MSAGTLVVAGLASGIGASWAEETVASNAAVALKASAGSLHSSSCDNSMGSGAVVVQYFDIAAAGVTLGTSIPVFYYTVEAGKKGGVLYRDLKNNLGATFATAISMAVTTAMGNNTAPSGTAPTVRTIFS